MSWQRDCLTAFDTWLYQKEGIYETRVDNKNQLRHVTPLPPVHHKTAVSQICINLNSDGTYKGMEVEKRTIIIPCTLESGMRSGSKAQPHPLYDNIKYIGKNSSKIPIYLQALQDWIIADNNANPNLTTIYTYISKGTISQDLSNIAKTKKEQVIRFKVDGYPCWTDTGLMNSWKKYYQNYLDEHIEDEDKIYMGTCEITGEYTLCVNPSALNKGCFSRAAQAFLVCGLDKNNSNKNTYLGRFQSPKECFSIGLKTASKIFRTLSYLSENYVVRVRDSNTIFIMFSPTGKKVLHPINNNPLGGMFGEEDEEDTNNDTSCDMSYQKELYELLYNNKYNIQDEVVIMTFTALTSGRVSMTNYAEIKYSQYINNLKKWHAKLQTTLYDTEYNPNLYDIVNFAFGRENKDKKVDFKDKTMLPRKVEELVMCRVLGRPIPYDIVKNIADKVSGLKFYSARNVNKLLAIASKLIEITDEYKKGTTPMLDTNCTDISYLYGRLLAIYDRVEQLSYKNSQSHKNTNAREFQQEFKRNPLSVCERLEMRTRYYFEKLPGPSKEYYTKLINNIYDLINLDESKSLSQLSDYYILGFRHQWQDFYKKSDKN